MCCELLIRDADVRSLVISAYVIYRLRAYVTPAVRQLLSDAGDKFHLLLTNVVSSAGSSAASLALGSLLTAYNQSRNFLASAGHVLAMPIPMLGAGVVSTTEPEPDVRSSSPQPSEPINLIDDKSKDKSGGGTEGNSGGGLLTLQWGHLQV